VGLGQVDVAGVAQIADAEPLLPRGLDTRAGPVLRLDLAASPAGTPMVDIRLLSIELLCSRESRFRHYNTIASYGSL